MKCAPREAPVPKKHRLSLEHIAHAATVIDPVFLNSPQYVAESLAQRLGCQLVVKIETLNPIRSFKGRGAEYLVSSLGGRPKLVCSTAGNFGQGMAYAARQRGFPITIFVPADANPLKVERMRALGADVRFAKDIEEGAAAKAFATESGGLLVEDGRDAPIAEGAGTIAVELLRWSDPFAAILVPLGDGSLLAGVSRWVKAHHGATEMIGVCAQGSPAMERSWRSGRVQDHRAETIADGLAVSQPHPEAIADLADQVDDIILVDDNTIVEAMRLAHQELGVVLEPSGAAGLAALMAHRERFRGQLAAVILTGGNLTAEQIRKWLTT
jgi:threonine dehydratase